MTLNKTLILVSSNRRSNSIIDPFRILNHKAKFSVPVGGIHCNQGCIHLTVTFGYICCNQWRRHKDVF